MWGCFFNSIFTKMAAFFNIFGFTQSINIELNRLFPPVCYKREFYIAGVAFHDQRTFERRDTKLIKYPSLQFI